MDSDEYKGKKEVIQDAITALLHEHMEFLALSGDDWDDPLPDPMLEGWTLTFSLEGLSTKEEIVGFLNMSGQGRAMTAGLCLINEVTTTSVWESN